MFKSLHRTRMAVFKDDDRALTGESVDNVSLMDDVHQTAHN